MSSGAKITLDTSGLDILAAEMGKLKRTVVNVGVLESGDARSDGKSNAMIGAVQELGFPEQNIPIRSWLQVPLEDDLQNSVNDLKTEGKKANEIAHSVGEAAVEVIRESFNTSGKGSWPAPKHRDGKPLVDTGELRDSVDFEVRKTT